MNWEAVTAVAAVATALVIAASAAFAILQLVALRRARRLELQVPVSDYPGSRDAQLGASEAPWASSGGLRAGADGFVLEVHPIAAVIARRD